MWTPIQANSSMPIYEQIMAQVVAVIASGGLKPNDYLPSIREMAGLMLVNPNTVSRAYRDLEQAGLIISVRGTGMLVRDEAVERTPAILSQMLRYRFRPILRDALAYGIDPQDLTDVFEEELDAMLSERNEGLSNQNSKSDSD
ncbi:MAG: HTH-type transcriptional repressor YtrA [Planctomycetota bacterium]|jgi:GntR family transcriptional regulator